MLSPGDLLLFYTDGLTEALGPDGQELGRAILPGLLRGLSAGSASEIVKGLISHLSRNSAELNPADDVSLIVMKMTGPSDGSQEYPPEMPPRARV